MIKKAIISAMPQIDALAVYAIGGMKALNLNYKDCSSLKTLYELGLLTLWQYSTLIDICLNDPEKWAKYVEKAIHYCCEGCKTEEVKEK